MMTATRSYFLSRPIKFLLAVIAIIFVTATSMRAASPEPTLMPSEAKFVEGAKKEGKVAFWCAGPAKEMEPVFGKFRQRYPSVQVEYWRAGDAEVQQKIIPEARAGVYNVDVVCTDLEFLVELKKAGLMKKHDWPNARLWNAGYKDADGYWVARHAVVAVIGYNTDLVKAQEAPKRWEDLWEPKWKGQISMPKDYDWVLMLWSAWGREKTVAYLKNLAKNNPAIGPGHTARVEMIAAGGMKVDVRLPLHALLTYQGKGAPIEFARTDPIVTKGTPMFIAEHAPHPNAAVLFADWLTSAEGQKAYHDATGHLMPNSEVKSKISDALRGLNVVATPASMAAYASEIGKVYTELFWK